MSSYTRIQLEDWLKTIEIKNGRVLDCGGSQNPLSKNRLKVFEPDEYKILDLENPHEGKKLDIVWDLNDLMAAPYEEDWWDIMKSFDVVFCLEVFEYIFNPFVALKNINSFLKKDGLFYSSWHQIYPVHNPVKEDFLRYTPAGVQKLLQKTGFEILEMKPRLESDNSLIMPAFKIEEMRPAKDYDKHDWVGVLVKAKKI